jgi:hypothetical protein
MQTRRIPEWLRHAPTPGVRGFAALAGLESTVRGVLVSVWPIAMYRALGDAATVSRVYFLVGLATLVLALLVPWATRLIPRRWMYTLGCASYLLGAALAVGGGPGLAPFALLANGTGMVTIFICFNADVLDYIARNELGRSETLRLFYSALSWVLGPVLGVWLYTWWAPAPFILAACNTLILLTVFWVMRLGNGKLITRARGPAPNPLAYLGRFFRQPRLIAGWLFAVLRSSGWWVYVVYLPIFCIEAGLDARAGGVAVSVSSLALFATPLMLRWIQAASVRRAVRTGFLAAGLLFVLAGLVALAGGWPWATVLLMLAGSGYLVLLDICAGLPFLMAVRPSERTEMSAVYSSFRDVSGILTPGLSYFVLLVAPVAGTFVACGAGLLGAWALAARLHPRLGARRPSHGRHLDDLPTV